MQSLRNSEECKCTSDGKESACIVEDQGSTAQLGRTPGEGNSYALQDSGLENSRDCIVHGDHKELDTTERLSLTVNRSPKRSTWMQSQKTTE